MKIRKFNESLAKNLSDEYIIDLFQSFLDDGWKITIHSVFTVGKAFIDNGSIDALTKVEDKDVKGGKLIVLKKAFGAPPHAIINLKEYDEVTSYFSELKSKIEILVNDGAELGMISLNEFHLVRLYLNTNDVWLDINKVKKVRTLISKGFNPDSSLIAPNKMNIYYPNGNNTEFAKLYKYQVSKQTLIDRSSVEFRKWFHDNFKIEIDPNVDEESDDTGITLTVL